MTSDEFRRAVEIANAASVERDILRIYEQFMVEHGHAAPDQRDGAETLPPNVVTPRMVADTLRKRFVDLSGRSIPPVNAEVEIDFPKGGFIVHFRDTETGARLKTWEEVAERLFPAAKGPV